MGRIPFDRSNPFKPKKRIVSKGFYVLVLIGFCLLVISLFLPFLESHGVHMNPHTDEENITNTKWGYDFPLIYVSILIVIFSSVLYFFPTNLKIVVTSIVLYCLVLLFSLLYIISILTQNSAKWYVLRIGVLFYFSGLICCLSSAIHFLIKHSKKYPSSKSKSLSRKK